MSLNRFEDPETYPRYYEYVTKIEGHHCGVRSDCDWGGPCDWRAMCSCGWLGTQYSQYYNTGTYNDALKELLEHTSFNPGTYKAHVSANTSADMAKIAELATWSVSLDTVACIEKLTAGLREALDEQAMLLGAWEAKQSA